MRLLRELILDDIFSAKHRIGSIAKVLRQGRDEMHSHLSPFT